LTGRQHELKLIILYYISLYLFNYDCLLLTLYILFI